MVSGGKVERVAGVLLVAAVLLPLCALDGGDGERTRIWAWQAGSGWGEQSVLLAALLWPLARAAAGLWRRAGWRRVLRFGVEPLCALLSVTVLASSVALAGTVVVPFPLLPWVVVRVAAVPAAGLWVALLGDALYLLLWVVRVGRVVRRGRAGWSERAVFIA